MEKTIEIPEGYEARIEGNKVIIELKESEDEIIRKALIELVRKHCVNETRCMMEGWLEKQGSQILANSAKTCKVEQKPAWSEEDEDNLYHINALIEDSSLEVRRQECLSGWLKSFKERCTWKPSDEQIKVFEHFVRSIGESGYMSPYDLSTGIVYSLLDDLKKLKG